MTDDLLDVRAAVREALEGVAPVVALESTLIAHGLPWPRNLEAARSAEAMVRAAGAVPATIAALGGVVRVGLDDAEIARIARTAGATEAGPSAGSGSGSGSGPFV